MSLYTAQNAWGWNWDNLSTADTPSAAAFGVAVTSSSTADTYGNYANICTTNSVTTLAYNVHAMELLITNASATANAIGALLTIGVDLGGGTTYATTLAENIQCGQAEVNSAAGVALRLWLPVFIPATASVGAKLASSRSTTTTSRISARYWGAPSRPDAIWTGSGCESVGVTVGSVPTNCDATAVTPGNSGSWGSWTSLGTCAKNLKYINLCVGQRNDTTAGLAYYFELAHGDGTNNLTHVRRHLLQTTTNERVQHVTSPHAACDIPAGSTLYVRGTCSGTADTGWTAMALGVY